MNFLSKNKQIFDIYNFKKALKRVRLIRKVISSCFAAYGIIFLARKSSNLIFSSTCYVSVGWNYMEYIFRDWPMICQRVSVSMTIKVVVFVVFLHFFTVFCVFSLPFLSFVKSFNQIRTQQEQLRMFFWILLFSFARFSFVSNLFFFLTFSRCFLLHYVIICV